MVCARAQTSNFNDDFRLDQVQNTFACFCHPSVSPKNVAYEFETEPGHLQSTITIFPFVQYLLLLLLFKLKTKKAKERKKRRRTKTKTQRLQ